MKTQISRKRTMAVIVTIVLLCSFVGSLLLINQPAEKKKTDLLGTGYVIQDAIIDEYFLRQQAKLNVEPIGLSAAPTFSSSGLSIPTSNPNDSVVITKDVSADTVALSANIHKIIVNRTDSAVFSVSFNVGSVDFYNITIETLKYETKVTYLFDVGGQTSFHYADFFYDFRDKTDILVHVEKGAISIGIDGIGDSCIAPSTTSFQSRLFSIKVGAGAEIPALSSIMLTKVQIGLGTPYHYNDFLHKTILPDGKDFAFVLHMHADRAYPQQLSLMANLSSEYGLMGTYDAWYRGNYAQYGMESPNYTAALHDLKNSGWDIGIHGGSILSMTKEEVSSAIENMTAEFGPIRTWSDHGAVLQDLYLMGTNSSSVHYTEELIRAIGAAWWNNNTHSHIFNYDLNRGGMAYNVTGYEDVPSFRVSYGYGRDFFDGGRQDDLSTYLRGWAYDRSVFVMHDYMTFYFYVTNETDSYSIMPDQDGFINYDWSELNPKLVFVNSTWSPLPRFLELLNFTKGYDVWFSTVREIYDRSSIVQQIEITETENTVTLTNPTAQQLSGFTLFTKSLPGYSLAADERTYQAGKGAVDSWHFVLDLAPGETVVLHKIPIGTGSPTTESLNLEAHAYTGTELFARTEQKICLG